MARAVDEDHASVARLAVRDGRGRDLDGGRAAADLDDTAIRPVAIIDLAVEELDVSSARASNELGLRVQAQVHVAQF